MANLDLPTLRAMARSPQHHSVYELSGALHQALDRMEQAERERDVLAIAYAYADHLQSCPAIQYVHGDCDCGYREIAHRTEQMDYPEGHAALAADKEGAGKEYP